MRRIQQLSLIIFALLATLATAEENPEAKIIGRWHGVGIMSQQVWVFNKDHTCLGGEDKSTWTYKNGKYLIDDGAIAFVMDAQGRLVFKEEDEAPDVAELRKWVLVREGAVTAVAPSDKPTTKTLTGQWRYVYTRNSLYPVAPTYDIIDFGDQARVFVANTNTSQQLAGKFLIADSTIRLSALGPNLISDAVLARLEEKGKILVLTPVAKNTLGDTVSNWYYMRAEALLANEVAGSWIEYVDSYINHYEMRPDGICTITVNDARSGKLLQQPLPIHPKEYYRLWPAPFGKAMTTVAFTPELGLMATVLKYERRGEELIITPVMSTMDETMMPMESGKSVWKREMPKK